MSGTTLLVKLALILN